MDSHVTTFLSILRSVQEHDLVSLVEELLSWVGAISLERQRAIASGFKIDVAADVLIYEPGGTRRTEKWAFDCKNLEGDRISVQTLRDIKSQMRSMAPDFDVLCLITPWRVTSLARSTSDEDHRLRIWDLKKSQVTTSSVLGQSAKNSPIKSQRKRGSGILQLSRGAFRSFCLLLKFMLLTRSHRRSKSTKRCSPRFHPARKLLPITRKL